MFHREAADEGARREESVAGAAEPRIGRERLVGLQPGADGALREVKMGASAQDALGVGYGVAEVEGGDGVEDELEWVGSVSSRAGGEAVLALGALEKGKRLQAVATPAFLYRIVRLAFRADGVFLFGFSGGHKRGVLGLVRGGLLLFVQHGLIVVNAGRALGR